MQPIKRIAGSRLGALLTVVLSLLLAACPAEDVEEGARTIPPPAPPASAPPVATYTVSGTINNLTGDELHMQLVYYDAAYTIVAGKEEIVVRSGENSFFFTIPIPDGRNWEIFAEVTNDRTQRCLPEPSGGVIASTSATVVMTCTDTYTIGGDVYGLRQGTEIRLRMGSPTLGNSDVTVDGSGPFEFEDPLFSGSKYTVTVSAQPQSPAPECTVTRGEGVVDEANVDDIRVDCGASVSYEVAGLEGSGLIVSLSREVTINGNTNMLVVERDEVAANGPYTFDTRLNVGEPYEVGVWQQPVNPDQQCSVSKGRGTIGDGGGSDIDVSGVNVVCYAPVREWRFDTSNTINTDFPIKSGRQEGGFLEDTADFDDGSGGTTGDVGDELRFSDLFQNYFHGAGSIGVVHSSSTGLTYWLAAEATKERGAPETSPIHYASLKTYWRVRKDSPQTSFELQITKMQMIANGTRNNATTTGRLWAGAELRITAYHVNDPSGVPAPIFDTHGGMHLRGTVGASASLNNWEMVQRVLYNAPQPLWSRDDFTEAQTIGVSRPGRTGYAELAAPITVDVDLSLAPVGSEILVVSEAVVEAQNTFAPEGAAAAYLRDPGEFDPGVTDGGVTLVSTSGVTQLDVGDDIPFDDLEPGGPAPVACDAAVTDRSILAFEAAEYRVSETLGTSPYVLVTRTGNLDGAVTAQLSFVGGTAEPDVDFETEELTVRFGDGDDVPRTVVVPIVDDDVGEGDETMLVMLHSPEGCADIGGTSSTTITIADNETGTVSFDSDSYEVDESAGVAILTLQRTNGDLGTIFLSVVAEDGTATFGSDYAWPLRLRVFDDGDATPQVVEVPILDDGDVEGDETVILSLVSSNDDIIGSPSTAVLTIRDDDP